MTSIKNTTLDQVMQTSVITLSQYDTVTQAVETFKKHRFHHIPILDDDKQIVGILSQTDINKISWGKSLFQNQRNDELNRSLYETLLIADVMTRNVHFLFPNQTVGQAVKIFDSGQFHAIPIIENGEVVGIVCPQDIMNIII